ncbi:receptor-type tyrosine-protein phosphatase epsilon-like [Argopecten irradians]|uniref:receptor-type tyrosine-protein phosphatase epsilon-like n=1 Tax=Argopecten irradians TaxID=31199 RepID=UPI00371B226C
MNDTPLLNCPDPVSSDPHLMMDTATYHNYVVFTCDSGYKLSSIYYFAQCKNGTWDQAIPGCQAIECLVDSELLLYPSDTKFFYGDTVSFSCPIGYEMKGPTVLTCGADSLWGQNLPECIAKECKLKLNGRDYSGHMNVTTSGRVCQSWSSQTPHVHGYYKLADQSNYCRNPNHNVVGPWCFTLDPSVQWELCDIPRCVCELPTEYDSHLMVDIKEYYFGDRAYLSCVHGYELIGARSLQCTSDGSWSTVFPTCQAIECQIQSNIDNKIMYHVRTYYYNDIVELSCVHGYVLMGSSSLSCLSTGSWSSTFPTCSAVQCGISGHHPHLRYQLKTYHFSDEIHFSCPLGFSIIGQEVLLCTADGSWSMPYPTCMSVLCAPPGEEHHLLYADKIYGYGDTISLACQDGYTMIGSSSLICSADGNWDAELPTCQGVPCPMPDNTVEHLLLTEKLYRYTDELQFSCEEGFRVDGRSTLVCQANGVWDGNLPVCLLLLDCPALSIPDEMIQPNVSREASHHSGTNVGFTCPTGHVIIGSASITCEEDGTWSAPPPQCVQSSGSELQKAEMSSGLIGGLIAAIVLVAALVIMVFFITKKRKKRKKKPSVNRRIKMESFKPNYDEMDSDISDDFDSFSDSFEYIEGPKDAHNPYYEFTPLSCTPEGTIAVGDLPQFVNKGLKADGYISSTFAKFKEGLQDPATVANLPENKTKNRYKHVFPYDTTRVCLVKEAGDTSDYINASYINGFEKIHQYVAAQGPMRTTVIEFWKMMWQLGSTKIVMVTNLIESGKTKCQQYWPSKGTENFGIITVTMKREENFGTFVIRYFKVSKDTVTRSVTQFHYTDWPDQKAPPSATSLVQFYRKVESLIQPPDVPLVVHCSAGIGRTGTYIALACLVQEVTATGYVSVTRCVETLRRQRLNMVQTTKQFVFIHEALLEHLHGYTAIPVSEFKPNLREPQEEYRILQSVAPKLPESAFLDGKKEENKSKNRYSNLLPVDKHRPILSTPVEGTNDYINAVFLSDGSKHMQYLSTQMPLPNTVIDFWRLVHEQHVASIVMLNTDNDQQDATLGVYWPTEEQPLTIGPFVVTEQSRSTNDLTDVYTLSLQYKQEVPTIVRQFRSSVWPDSEACPKSAKEFLKLLGLVREWQSSHQGPLLVHCTNGLDKSGLYCVLDSILQSAEVTKLVDIHTTIKQMRRAQPQIIINETQYRFCYQAISEYLEQHSTYMNL